MNILIVGAGGREHALAWKCCNSSYTSHLHVTPGNGGIDQIATCWGLTDHDQIIKKAKEEEINLVIFGQEDYLVDGLSDRFREEKILVFGPSKKASQLEGSKAFSKAFMAKYNIPTAAFKTTESFKDGLEYLEEIRPPYVIKADGLAAGKGVIISRELEHAKDELKKMMVDGSFKDAGKKVVIEEFLNGQEASFFVITDGENYVTLPALQDHKRQGELDEGLNTGGMGCYAPAPIVDEETKEYIIENVVEPTIKGMKAEGAPYSGVIYIGLMIEKKRASVVEYNIRFGDPECQTIMSLLESDLVEICKKTAEGKVDELSLKWKNDFATTVVLASGGYPLTYEKGNIISGLEKISPDANVFHAGTKKDDGFFTTNGGRVLSVTSYGKTFLNAIDKTYQEVRKIHWKDMFYRRDIGLKGLGLTEHHYDHFNVSFIFNTEAELRHINDIKETFDLLQIRFNTNLINNSLNTEEMDRIIDQYSLLKSDIFVFFGEYEKVFLENFIHKIHRPIFFAQMSDDSVSSKYQEYGIVCNNHDSLFPNLINILCSKYEDVEARVRLMQLQREIHQNELA